MTRMRNRTITIRLWVLQLCVGLCLVSRIVNCDDLSVSLEEIESQEITSQEEYEDDTHDRLAMPESRKCVRYGPKKGDNRLKLYCDLCSIDHEEEENLPERIAVVKTSKCWPTGETEYCVENALTAVPTKQLKPVCGRKGGKDRYYCGFCSLQKEMAVFKPKCEGDKPSCEGESQVPDGTTTQAPDTTKEDETYQYVKQYCVASEEYATCHKCTQKSPSFKVKMPEFLKAYRTKL